MQHPKYAEARTRRAIDAFAEYVRALPLPKTTMLRLLDLGGEIALASSSEAFARANKLVQKSIKAMGGK